MIDFSLSMTIVGSGYKRSPVGELVTQETIRQARQETLPAADLSAVAAV